ncbi:hypothetical protein HPB52_012767 [Rhipicephalus sanguineus]|uniref:Uncharacterized protein n=1 Tax=Rhipicephalus sanguineus TaxID=34632 RepID=A0A9D4QDH5_RHISA|nr:hypothetical protein HPB52_012767 [Rhipicephalus sanguineus]
MEWDDWWARREEGNDDDGGGHSPRMDSRLAHLVEVKKSALKRLYGQKHNRYLRRKITELNKHIDAMNGNSNTGKTWKILKHLLDPSATKTAAKAEITKIRHKYILQRKHP